MQPRTDEQRIAGSTVMIVDDNRQNAELLEAFLEDLEVTVECVPDGITAIERIQQSPPDLILLDIMMPRMSGFEVCKKLKSDPATTDIPIIMVTALSEMGDIERAVDCGTNDFLSKPVNKLELQTRVRSLLKLRGLKSDLDRALGYLDDLDHPSRRSDVHDDNGNQE